MKVGSHHEFLSNLNMARPLTFLFILLEDQPLLISNQYSRNLQTLVKTSDLFVLRVASFDEVEVWLGGPCIQFYRDNRQMSELPLEEDWEIVVNNILIQIQTEENYRHQ